MGVVGAVGLAHEGPERPRGALRGAQGVVLLLRAKRQEVPCASIARSASRSVGRSAGRAPRMASISPRPQRAGAGEVALGGHQAVEDGLQEGQLGEGRRTPEGAPEGRWRRAGGVWGPATGVPSGVLAVTGRPPGGAGESSPRCAGPGPGWWWWG